MDVHKAPPSTTTEFYRLNNVCVCYGSVATPPHLSGFFLRIILNDNPAHGRWQSEPVWWHISLTAATTTGESREENTLNAKSTTTTRTSVLIGSDVALGANVVVSDTLCYTHSITSVCGPALMSRNTLPTFNYEYPPIGPSIFCPAAARKEYAIRGV